MNDPKGGLKNEFKFTYFYIWAAGGKLIGWKSDQILADLYNIANFKETIVILQFIILLKM